MIESYYSKLLLLNPNEHVLSRILCKEAYIHLVQRSNPILSPVYSTRIRDSIYLNRPPICTLTHADFVASSNDL